MQFFPDLVSHSVSALGGVGLPHSAPGKAFAKANHFLESLNGELAASGISPIVDVAVAPGLVKGFRTIKRDVAAKLDREDVSSILDKLRKRGVNESALSGIEGLLNGDVSPTIGGIMGAIRGKGRVTEELSDEEMQILAGAFQKLQLTPEETEEFTRYMEEGRGFEAMRMLKAKAAELGEGAFTLTPEEARALMRGMDISEKTIQKVASLFGEGEEGKSLEDILGPITEELATRRSEME
ncbi:MAG: hypothetical protein LIP28_06915, partial [Deltaproteobacteria bacterium]|nr:hypothetical protein [Deltaproteobacteria bacterium]